MKKYIYYIIPILLMSCNSYLDTLPDKRTVIDSETKVKQLLVSAYPNRLHTLLAEIMSDNVDDNTSSFNYYNILVEEVYNLGQITATTQDSPYYVWQGYYGAIAAANEVLRAIEEMGDTDNLQPYKGEALICRAYSHFMLVNLFCMHYSEKTSNNDLGIYYITEPETTVSPVYERGTVAKVYEKIEKDIEEGLPLIDDNIYDIPKYHFNRNAAYAFAARFNLYYLKYDKVIEYASVVLGDNPKTILRDWEALNNMSYRDNIMAHGYINDADNANLLIICAGSQWPRSCVSTNYSRYTHNRFISTNETNASSGPWGSYTNFYSRALTYSGYPLSYVPKIGTFTNQTLENIINNTVVNYQIIPVFTTDELLLCRAESYIMQEKYNMAIKDLDMWLSNFSRFSGLTEEGLNDFYANLAYYTPNRPTPKKELNPDFKIKSEKQENFLHGLLHMRRILTMHEGLRWFDVKRYGITVHRRVIGDIGISFKEVTDIMEKNDLRRAVQLPSQVISAGMEPNPR